MNMPRTNYHLREDNSVERMFWGRYLWNAALPSFIITKEVISATSRINWKYGGRKDLGEIMGRFMAAELAATGFSVV